MEMQLDPFAVPMVFLRVGWMDRYQGTISDPITGGGAYVAEHNYGHEIFNFQPFQGVMYGYVQPSGSNAQINLTRLGAAVNDTLISGVLIVWVATPSSWFLPLSRRFGVRQIPLTLILVGHLSCRPI